MTPEQKRRNKIAGLVLLAIVLALFGWTIFRGSVMFVDTGTY